MAPPFRPSPMIWHDGALRPWAEASTHVLGHSLNYGSSVFEGIRSYRQGADGAALFRLDRHIERLYDSARTFSMTIPYRPEELADACLRVVRENGLRDAYVRPIAYYGLGAMGPDPRGGSPVEVAIGAFEWQPLHGRGARVEGLDAGVSSWRRQAPGTMPVMAKSSGGYGALQLVAIEAARHGYAEGIILNVDGDVAEASGANIFVVVGDELWTPPRDASILPGITRDSVISLARDLGVSVRETRIPREQLYACREIFLTGTAAEIAVVRSVDGVPVGDGRRGPITAAVQGAFFGVIQGEAADVRGWLTSV